MHKKSFLRENTVGLRFEKEWIRKKGGLPKKMSCKCPVKGLIFFSPPVRSSRVVR